MQYVNLIERSGGIDANLLTNMRALPFPHAFPDRITLLATGALEFFLKNSQGQNSSTNAGVTRVSLFSEGVGGMSSGDVIRIEWREPSSTDADFDDYIVHLVFR